LRRKKNWLKLWLKGQLKPNKTRLLTKTTDTMASTAFQKIYTKLTQITKATCSLHATQVGYEEMATVNGRMAQVIKIQGDLVTLQVFSGTEGLPTNAEVVFLGHAPQLLVGDELNGRFFNALGNPIDGGRSRR
jgi:V/A-type H+-transporting ATPase subunit B